MENKSYGLTPITKEFIKSAVFKLKNNTFLYIFFENFVIVHNYI